MMKPIPQVLALLLGLSATVQAQTSVTGVSTSPMNKVAVVEEFTGVRCPNCPDGHIVLEQMINTYGSNMVTISYHPNNSSFTPPYAGDPDLQRSYPASFYATPFCGSSRFMPSAFINRRQYSGERIQSRGVWDSYTAAMIQEASPVNVGVIGTYNPGTKILSITAEAYYTSTVTDLNSIYVMFMEDSITVAQQSGASGSYVQNRVFREAQVAQWGNEITTTTAGTLAQFTFTFDNTTTNYDMDQVRVIAFVENKTNQELYSGAQSDVTTNTVGVMDAKELSAALYPNPTSGDARIVFDLPVPSAMEWTVTTLQGVEVLRGRTSELGAGSHSQEIPSSTLAAGLYMVRLSGEAGTVTRRLSVQ